MHCRTTCTSTVNYYIYIYFLYVYDFYLAAAITMAAAINWCHYECRTVYAINMYYNRPICSPTIQSRCFITVNMCEGDLLIGIKKVLKKPIYRLSLAPRVKNEPKTSQLIIMSNFIHFTIIKCCFMSDPLRISL